MNDSDPKNSELGKSSSYDREYNPTRLFAIERAEKRREIGVDPDALPFYGQDIWQHYEVSWLNQKGKPEVALAIISYDCHSKFLVESKSLKLYFNSFNQHQFVSSNEVEKTIVKDLSELLQTEVKVSLTALNNSPLLALRASFTGECLDGQDVSCDTYQVEPSYLSASGNVVSETLYSDLLKSNCLITGQPDWGSVLISYQGPKIDRVGLLKYIVSFREHIEFHEQCIERIFVDIMQHCQPQVLSVYGRYTRRGGLDINPYRSTESDGDIKSMQNFRLVRQ